MAAHRTAVLEVADKDDGGAFEKRLHRVWRSFLVWCFRVGRAINGGAQ